MNYWEAAPNQPIETQICEAHGLWVKQIIVPNRETFLPQHAHVLSHVTLITNGSIRVWCDDEDKGQRDAPDTVYIKAGVKHTFQTLCDNTVLYCVHALNTPEALKVLAEHQLV